MISNNSQCSNNDSGNIFGFGGSMGNSLEYVNLKIGIRMDKIYKLVSGDKNKIHDYNYLVDKILSSNNLNNQDISIFFKCNSPDEIRINNEDEWKNIFENSSKSILELIDSKNTIKIEFIVNRSSNSDNNKQAQNSEELNIFEDDAFGMQMLRILFAITSKSETLKKKLKEEIIIKNPKNETILNSKNFDGNLKKYLEKTLDKLQRLSSFKSILSDTKDDESEINLEEDNELTNSDIPHFSDFYKEDELELLRTKIITESFAEVKKF